MRRILVFHNRYLWPGGEDAVVDADLALLRRYGHDAELHEARNLDPQQTGTLRTLQALWRGAWNEASYADARQTLQRFRPDCAHLHNLWFTLSPSVLQACRDEGVPVVMTLHNMRLLCPAGVFLDPDGGHCNRCAGGFPWLGLWRRCYHRSFWASLGVARMAGRPGKRAAWLQQVNLFLSPSDFVKRTFVEAGFSAENICVLPHGIPDPGASTILPLDPEPGSFPRRIVYIGRFSREKGLVTLLLAWKTVQAACPDAELTLLGEGPLENELRELAEGQRVRFGGRMSPDKLAEQIAGNGALVLPSECAETFGQVVIEAFACGRMAVVTDLGAPAELVEHGVTGLRFRHGDAASLAQTLLAALTNPRDTARMGQAARACYAKTYTPEQHYRGLLAAYETAIRNHQA